MSCTNDQHFERKEKTVVLNVLEMISVSDNTAQKFIFINLLLRLAVKLLDALDDLCSLYSVHILFKEIKKQFPTTPNSCYHHYHPCNYLSLIMLRILLVCLPKIRRTYRSNSRRDYNYYYYCYDEYIIKFGGNNNHLQLLFT